MAKYIVKGRDEVTNASTELSVELGNLEDAKRFAESRGVHVTMIVSDAGAEYVPQPGGRFDLRNPRDISPIEESGRKPSDTGLLVLSFLIPLVGFIAGAIRLAQRQSGGVRPIVWALVSCFVWALLIAAIGG